MNGRPYKNSQKINAKIIENFQKFVWSTIEKIEKSNVKKDEKIHFPSHHIQAKRLIIKIYLE